MIVPVSLALHYFPVIRWGCILLLYITSYYGNEKCMCGWENKPQVRVIVGCWVYLRVRKMPSGHGPRGPNNWVHIPRVASLFTCRIPGDGLLKLACRLRKHGLTRRHVFKRSCSFDARHNTSLHWSLCLYKMVAETGSLHPMAAISNAPHLFTSVNLQQQLCSITNKYNCMWMTRSWEERYHPPCAAISPGISSGLTWTCCHLAQWALYLVSPHDRTA